MKENEYNWMLSAIIQAQNNTHIFFLYIDTWHGFGGVGVREHRKKRTMKEETEIWMEKKFICMASKKKGETVEKMEGIIKSEE